MLILILSSFLMGSMPLTDNSQRLQPLCLLAGRVTDYEKYKQTTNIFIGEYTGEYTFLGTTLYIKLKIKSQLFGNIEEEYAWTRVGYADYTGRWGYHTSIDGLIDNSLYFYDEDLEENKGKEYLVPAEKYINVYYPFDAYNTISDEIFDMEKVWEQIGNITFEYGWKDRILWEDPNAPYNEKVKADVVKTFTDYIKYLVNYNTGWKDYTGQKYIQSENFDEIKERSKIVLRVKATNISGDSEKIYTPVTVSANCKVKEVIKGEIENDEINIQFVPGTVKKGKEYIVCIKNQGGLYEITAKNAVQPAPADWYSIGAVIVSALVVFAVGCLVYAVKRRRTKPCAEER